MDEANIVHPAAAAPAVAVAAKLDSKPSAVTEQPPPSQPDKPTEAIKIATPPKGSTPQGRTPTQSLEINRAKPEDFEGELATNNELPSPETLRKIENYIVLDRHGKTHTFKSLYSGSNVARRVLVIFVRHFFCGVRTT